MFSFHKPKIYRSNLGCCICKAKSSSSRFTDSKKYESEFEKCFRITEQRSGEICNACVLLVKRWKKLSPENRLTKHWHHVVDARAGPGTKLTGNRRLTASINQNNSGNNVANQNASTLHHNHHHPLHHHSYHNSNNFNANQDRKPSAGHSSNILPFSSSNANRDRQVSPPSLTSIACGVGPSPSGGGIGRRSANKNNSHTNGMFSSIDEPTRHSYMTPESTQYALTRSHHMSSLNSKAFESVIKRFRQRQQQQQLEARRRQQDRRKRQQQDQASMNIDSEPNLASNHQCNYTETLEQSTSDQVNANRKHVGASKVSSKRTDRNSIDSIGSLVVDGFRVSSLLDGALWRKERICCGTIFRGPLDEVAIIPRLFSPCQGRCEMLARVTTSSKSGSNGNVAGDKQAGDLLNVDRDESPPRPRAAKSGSISSCDSNTSGVLSMDGGVPVLEEQSGSPTSSSSSTSDGLGGIAKRRLSSHQKLSETVTATKSREVSRSRRHKPQATKAMITAELEAEKTDTLCNLSNNDSNIGSSDSSSSSTSQRSSDPSTGLSLKCSSADRRQQLQRHQQSQKLVQSSASRLTASDRAVMVAVVESEDSDDFEEAMVMDEDAIDGDHDLLEDASPEMVTGEEEENSSSIDGLSGEVDDKTNSAVSVP